MQYHNENIEETLLEALCVIAKSIFVSCFVFSLSLASVRSSIRCCAVASFAVLYWMVYDSLSDVTSEKEDYILWASSVVSWPFAVKIVLVDCNIRHFCITCVPALSAFVAGMLRVVGMAMWFGQDEKTRDFRSSCLVFEFLSCLCVILVYTILQSAVEDPLVSKFTLILVGYVVCDTSAIVFGIPNLLRK